MEPLSEQITIERAAATTDAIGGRSRTWSTLYTLFCAIEAQGAGSEEQRAERLQALGRYSFRVRHIDCEGVRESDRVLWNDEYYGIKHVERPGRSLYKFLHCEKGQST